MTNSQALTAPTRTSHIPPSRGVPQPVPGSQGRGEPVITDKQRRRLGTEGVDNASTTQKVMGYIGLFFAVCLILVPLYFITITSLKSYSEVYSDPITFWPSSWVPGNYSHVWNTSGFVYYLRNSIFITLILTVVKIVLGVASAYAFAFLRFPLKNLLFVLVIAALMVPGQITIISNYALVAAMGWRNTYLGVILPLSGVAFGCFLMKNHFESLPKEVLEAAEMDNAGFLTKLFRVVLPMSWPTLSAFVVITIVNEWNEYLWPFLITDTPDAATLPIGLTRLQEVEGMTNWGPVMAGTVLTTLPMLIVFLVMQKPMIRGLTAGAVKG